MGMNLDAGAHPGPMGNQSPHAPHGVHLRVSAALSLQLLLCRTLGCSCSATPLSPLFFAWCSEQESPLLGTLALMSLGFFGWVVAALCVWFAMLWRVPSLLARWATTKTNKTRSSKMWPIQTMSFVILKIDQI